MEHWKLTKWCTEAVTKIKYPPDRRAVYDELRQHMDDRCEDFLEQGLSKEEAVDKVVNVMGDPHELAVQLAAIHRPFWPLACIISKWLMGIVVILTIIISLGIKYKPIDIEKGTRIDSHYTESNDSSITRVLYLEPNCSDSSDGYTFTVTRVAMHEHAYFRSDGQPTTFSGLHIEVEVKKDNPLDEDCHAVKDFWGIDNTGKVYTTGLNHIDGAMNCSTNSYNVAVNYYHFTIYFEEAENPTWFELHYDRAGRDIVLHIDLTGGGIA